MRLAAALVLVGVLLGVDPALGIDAAPDVSPSIELDKADAAVGEQVVARLAGWPSGNVTVELCGDNGEGDSAACAVATSVSTFIRGDGTGVALLAVAPPPVSCPCVVRATDLAGTTAGTVPISVRGLPTGRPEAASSATTRGRLAVTDLRVADRDALASFFAAPVERVLVVTVRNIGEEQISDLRLSVTVGRGESPTGFVTSPRLGTIEPGAERAFRIPVVLAPPAFGAYTIRGEIAGLEQPVVFTAETSTYPWVVPTVLALVTVLLAVSELRRRRSRRRA